MQRRQLLFVCPWKETKNFYFALFVRVKNTRDPVACFLHLYAEEFGGAGAKRIFLLTS
jgi:hypothetical protein